MILEREAATRWLALLNLDEHGRDRRELLAAGVPEHAVASLYPSEFEALTSGIIEAIGAETPEPVPSERWRRVHGEAWSLRGVLLKFRREMAEELLGAKEDFALKPSWPRLYTHLRNILPAAEEEQAGAMVLDLWQAHWMMDHAPQLPAALNARVQTNFCDVIKWVLPNLVEAKA